MAVIAHPWSAPRPRPTRAARGLRALPTRARVALRGVHIDQVSRTQASRRLRSFLNSGTFHQVATVNLDFLRLADQQPAFLQALNEADLAVADGMPLVWASRLKGQPLAERVTGVELVDEVCRLAAEMGKRVFLLGAAPGVADAAAAELVRRYPGLQIAGTCCPPYGPLGREQDEAIVRQINDAQADVLLVALGAPRQDLWISAHRGLLNVSVAMGVGCTFDLLAGQVSRAPQWMQQTGLEWAYRLAHEPRRLWHRYMVDDLPTFGALLAECVIPANREDDAVLADAEAPRELHPEHALAA